MLAELTLLVGTLKTLNEGIKTVKESSGHLKGISGLFSALTESKVAVETIEHKQKEGDHILSQEECLELAWAKAEIRKKEKELKKHTPREVWRDMLNIQHKSVMDHKSKLEKQRIAKNRAITKREETIKSVFGTTILIGVGVAVYYGTQVIGTGPTV
jgi:hypothetical protein|tara:strand:- start:253 stop:723 length:471 start_codon:yes stop_codon:yes gene_type:complete